jgi:hypothetical protein
MKSSATAFKLIAFSALSLFSSVGFAQEKKTTPSTGNSGGTEAPSISDQAAAGNLTSFIRGKSVVVKEGATPHAAVLLQDESGKTVATLKADAAGRVAWTPTKDGACKGFTKTKTAATAAGEKGAGKDTVIIKGLIYK